jgi:hypothetical protein
MQGDRAATGSCVEEAGVLGGAAERQRLASSSTSHLQQIARGSDTSGPEAAMAEVCGDGVAGELEAGRSGQ